MKQALLLIALLAFALIIAGCIDENTPIPGETPTPTPSATITPKPSRTPLPTPTKTQTPTPSKTPEPTPETGSFEIKIPPKGYFSIPVFDPEFTVQKACSGGTSNSIRVEPRNQFEKQKILFCVKDKNIVLEPGNAYYMLGLGERTNTVTGTAWKFPELENSEYTVDNFQVFFGGTYKTMEISEILGDCNSENIKIIDLLKNKAAEEIYPGGAYRAFTLKGECTLGTS